MDPSLANARRGQTPKETYVVGLYYLVKGWMHTLRKLNEPKDIQAIMTCARSMVEITVDLDTSSQRRDCCTLYEMLSSIVWQKFRTARSSC